MLEKLEIENFKSYAGMHTVGPFDRITCIIGPNGSGKSNIMDAISFCAGVGSAYLRSSNVRTLIHDNRGQARVALFIKHENVRKVFGRCVAVDGESGYSVDGRDVIYEKFKEALEEMNIMVHIRNFLVFQGDINVMANMSPAELTRLFEEMSGSIELKNAYDKGLAAQNKALSDCSLLFEKRKEILAEMKEAKEIKEQEKMFRELVEKRDRIQGSLILHKVRDRIRKVEEMEGEIAKLKEKESRIQELLDSKETEVDVCRRTGEIAQREYFEVENEISKQKEHLKEAEIMLSEIEQRKDKNEMRRMELEIELRSKEQDISSKENEVARKRRELEAVEQGYIILCKEDEKRKGRLVFDEEKKRILDDLEEKMKKMIAKDQELLNALDLEMFPNITLLEQQKERLAKLKSSEERLRGAIEEKKILRENTILKIAKLEKAENECRERIASSESDYERIVEMERDKNSVLSQLLGEILRAKGQRRINERRCTIRSAVETLKTIFPGVYGRVVDIVKPTQSKYEMALSVLLGSHDQSVVVDTELTAVSCINFVKEKKLCKMTLLPVQSMKEDEVSRSMINTIRQTKGFDRVVRPAVDTISYDKKYKKVVGFLFRDSLIVDTMEVAKKVCYNMGIRANVCTLDGVYFHGRGKLITSGFKESKFRENEIDDLLNRRMKVLEELREIQESKSKFSHVETARERMNMWRESRDREVEVVRRTDSDIEELESKLRNNVMLQNETKEYVRRVEREVDSCGRRMRELTMRIEAIESEVFSDIFPDTNFKSYKEYKECVEDNVFVQKAMEYESVRDRIKVRIDILNQEIASLKEDVGRIKGDIEALNTHCDTSLLNADVLDKDFEVLNEERRRRLDVFERARKDLKKVNDEFRSLVCSKSELDRNMIYNVSMKERLEEEIKESLNFAMLEEIEVPYKRRCEGTPSMDDIDFSGMDCSYERLCEELEETNQRINDQVPFTRVKQDNNQSKYMKISAEYERAKEIAVAAKKELNEIKRRRTGVFMECFEKVNGEMTRIYKSLTMTETSEGSACLVLENVNEPFREGIRFHLMPPNKRFREVKLLSGGEKTIAVLSLLFSFNSHRPVPFYVFDEIDSALDNSNVSRIVSFMISCGVQFIIITHKPTLFQQADGLVGVYRDPQENVSKILTYRLSE